MNPKNQDELHDTMKIAGMAVGAIMVLAGLAGAARLWSDRELHDAKPVSVTEVTRTSREIQADTVEKLTEWAERDLRLAEMVLDGARTPSEKKEAELMYESAWKKLEELRKEMVAIKSGDRMQR